jgi:outer membrane protein
MREGRRAVREAGRWVMRAMGCPILLLWAAGLGAQAEVVVATGRPVTEAEAVRLAVEQSARVRAADADAGAAAARARETRAGLLPSVRAQGAYTRIGGDIPDAEFILPGMDTAFTLLAIERDRYHSELSVEQPLFAGGRLRAGYRAADRMAAAAEWAAAEARADVALEARRAYWSLNGALSAMEAMDAALVQVEAHLRAVRRRFEEGALLRADVLAVETRRSQLLLDRLEARNAVQVWRLELNRLLGLTRDAEVTPVDAGTGIMDPSPVDAAWVERAVAARPELRALSEQVAALRAQEAIARGGHLPEVAFVSRYIYARPNPYVFTEQGEFRGTWEAGVAVRWGLWEGGAQRARSAAARDQRRAAEARLEEAQEMARVDIARRQLETERAAEALAVAGQVVEQAAESLRVARQQFAEGAALSSQVLEAEAAYRTALARQARAVAERAIARAELDRSLGEG